MSQSSEGDTPVESGTYSPHPSPEETAKFQRLISPTRASVLALLVGAIATSAVIEGPPPSGPAASSRAS